MKSIKYILITLILAIIGCSGGKSREGSVKNEEDKITISLPYSINLLDVISKVHSENLSSISNNISYIPLETKSECLLRRINEYVFFNDKLIVSDFSRLYQFDSQGKFISKISEKGEGPSDYTYINSIVKNDKSNSFYLFTAGKINIYDQKLQYSKSIPNTERMYFGKSTPEGIFLMYLGCLYRLVGDTTTIYSFMELDTLGNVLTKIPNSSPIESSFNGMILGTVPLYKHKESMRFMDYGNDTLFTYTKNEGKVPYAIFNLGSMKRDVDISRYNEQQIAELSSKFAIYNICEDDRFLYISLVWGVDYNKFQYILFDKNTGELKNLGNHGFVNDIDGGVSFFPQSIEDDGTKVMWMDADSFIEKISSSDYQTQKDKYKEKFDNIRELASKKEDDDNPIFIITK